MTNCWDLCCGALSLWIAACIKLFLIDIKRAPAWGNLATLQDPELKGLADSLLGTVLKSRAPSTTNKYAYATERWRQWASQKEEIVEFPVKDYQFALYLQHIAVTVGSRTAVEEAVNAVSWLQQLSGQTSVAESPLIKATLAGLQRQLAKQTTKKEPVTVEMLQMMAESAGCTPTLAESRLLAMSFLAFAAFLRCDELVRLKCCNIKFHADRIVVMIESSKTDQFREGAEVVVARTGTKTCPIAVLEQYVTIADIDPSSTEKLFRAIVKSKNGERLRKGVGISYSRIR